MKYLVALGAVLAITATPLDRSRRYSGPTQQDIDSARARDKKRKVREAIRARAILRKAGV